LPNPLTEVVRLDLESNIRRDEDALLSVLLLAPGGSTRSLAEALGWLSSNGEPQGFRVHRVAKRLKSHGLIKDGREGLALTDKGRDAARKAAA
jgi:hypothetical protein